MNMGNGHNMNTGIIIGHETTIASTFGATTGMLVPVQDIFTRCVVGIVSGLAVWVITNGLTWVYNNLIKGRF